MFSVITNIYNKKTKGPTLMEIFHSHGKTEKVFFLTTRNVRCVHHGWHGTHRYDIQVPATQRQHVDVCVALPFSLLSSGVLYSLLQRVRIPDAVIIQFVFLKMGMLMLETYREL